MLNILNVVQLVLYIALLALVGQGVLYVISGARRDENFFYRLLQVISRPFTLPVRWITPRLVEDRQVPLVTFLLLVIIYGVVTFEKIDLCMAANMTGCR